MKRKPLEYKTRAHDLMGSAIDGDGWLDVLLEAIPRTRVAVFGDFCLDAYWLIDPDESELSVETHLPVHPGIGDAPRRTCGYSSDTPGGG